MRRLFLYSILLCWAVPILAQPHIQIADPETWTTDALYPYVGKTVVFDAPMYVVSNAYGDLEVAPRRIFTPTNQVLPKSEEYSTLLSLNAKGTMSLSGVSGYHRTGEKIYNLTVRVQAPNSLHWQSGHFRGNTRADLERGIPDLNQRGDYRILVCAANLEYYLVSAFDGGSGMGPANAREHEKQREKVSKALAKISADLYGLVEIQQGQEALREIAADLSRNTGHPYTFIQDGSSPNGTYTKSGYIYRTDKLRPDGQLYENNERVQNRKKIQAFEEIATGERFFFSINHFKAKGRGGSGLDGDMGDGQGSFNYSRTMEARSVITQYSGIRNLFGEDDILIMGDLNAYAKEDPITALTSVGMIDLHRAFHQDSSYSYTFRSDAGYLDHALCNGTLFPQVTGMAAYHINSDELDDYTYDKSSDKTMFRCSDHDPILVGLALDSTLHYVSGPSVSNIEVVYNATEEQIIFTNDLYFYNAYDSESPSFYRIYTTNGLLVEQGQITSNPYHIDAPSSAGVYIVHIYSGGMTYPRKIIVP